MTVFDLQATLGLDASAFQSDLDTAVADVTALETSADNLNKKPASSSSGTIITPVKEDVKSAQGELDSLKDSATGTSAFMEGLVRATEQLVEDSIQAVIEFCGEALEAAAATGSDAAKSYNASVKSLDVSLEAFKVNTGEKLMGVAEWWNDLKAKITGASLEEKIEVVARELENLAGVNLDKTKDQLKGIFGLFDEVDQIEVGNIGDMTKGLASQTAYWEKYAATLQSLRDKGVDGELLASLADGSQESLGQLLAMDQADTSQLDSLAASYNAVAEARAKAAQGISEVTLPFTEEAGQIAELIALLSKENSELWGFEDSGSAVLGSIVSGLTAEFPALQSIVSQISDELTKIGESASLFDFLTGANSGKTSGEGAEPIKYELDIVMADGSEDQLQSDVKAMDLQGDALIKADPSSANRLQSYLDGLKLTAKVKLIGDGSGLGGDDDAPGKAVGMDYVPYDDYAARLHEGEAVLTKLEAERWRRGNGFRASGGETTNVTQYITVAADEDFEDAVYRALQKMRWMS